MAKLCERNDLLLLEEFFIKEINNKNIPYPRYHRKLFLFEFRF